MADPTTTPVESLDDAIQPPKDAPVTPTPRQAARDTSSSVDDYTGLGKTREKLAFRLVWVMIDVIAVMVLVALAFSVDCWFAGGTCASQSTALNLMTTSIAPIFTAMVGLVGSVIGFYFGSKQTNG